MAEDNITIGQMQSAIERSGYLIETKLEAVLRKKGFRVEVNAPYLDPETGKQRELDHLASLRVGLPFGPDKSDWLYPVLVIECVNKGPLTLFTREWPADSHDSADRWEVLKIAGHPLHGSRKEIFSNWCWLTSRLGLQDFHHYAEERIATQYCYYEPKKGGNRLEWMAHHPKERHEELKGLMSAMAYLLEKSYEEVPSRGSGLELELFYPVLVLQKKFYEASIDETTDGFKLDERDHLQYRCSLIRGPRQADFQIDAVAFDHFPQFVDMILEESAKLAKRMDESYASIREVVNARRSVSRRSSTRSTRGAAS